MVEQVMSLALTLKFPLHDTEWKFVLVAVAPEHPRVKAVCSSKPPVCILAACARCGAKTPAATTRLRRVKTTRPKAGRPVVAGGNIFLFCSEGFLERRGIELRS